MNFDQAFELLIGHEGGYANDPRDPGGETMYGITARVARKYGYTGAMRDLPLTEAKRIARLEYWAPIRADELPDAIRFDAFDATYHSGLRQATILLQRAAGVAAVDGVLGPNTLYALQHTDPQLLDKRFSGYRLRMLADLAVWPTFGRGWTRRIASNLIGD